MHSELLTNILIILGAGVGVLALCRRLNLPPVIGYIAVGVLVGPYGLGWLPPSTATRFLAELGVVFLMFMVGLEFSLPRMWAAKGSVFGFGGAQVAVTGLLAAAAALGLGSSASEAFVAGGAVAMSSTAIGMRQLSEQAELSSRHGRIAIGVLLFQDLATLPLLVVIARLSQSEDGLLLAVAIALVKAITLFAALLLVGRWALTPAIAWVARSRSPELMMLSVLLIILGAAFVANLAGLSLPIGAFLAGMIIGETDFKHQVEDDIRPFRDVLLGLFFVTIGMALDPRAVFEQGLAVWGLLAFLIVGKAAIVMLLGVLFGTLPGTTLRAGLVLAQGGEFGLLMASLALDSGVIGAAAAQALLTSIVLSMTLAPLIIRHNERIARQAGILGGGDGRADTEHYVSEASHDLTGHVIICGYGGTGRLLALLFEQENIPYLAIDMDPARLDEARHTGHRVMFGDAQRRTILSAAGITRASLIAIAVGDERVASKVLHVARVMRADIPVVATCANLRQAERLASEGVSMVLPEHLATGLLLGAQILIHLGFDNDAVANKLLQLRQNLYPLLPTGQT